MNAGQAGENTAVAASEFGAQITQLLGDTRDALGNWAVSSSGLVATRAQEAHADERRILRPGQRVE
jgi:hypothetical protein